jgi:hypothetical protein
MPRVNGVAAGEEVGGRMVPVEAMAGREGRAAPAVATSEVLRKVRLELGIEVRSKLGSGACKLTWTG